MLILFFVLPIILLCAYPLSFFQRCLNKTGLNSLVLYTFIDVFQGYYKDGTNGKKDFRCLSVLPFLIPLLVYFSFALTQFRFMYYYCSFYILLYLAIILVLQPYKQFIHNFITAAMLICLLLACWSMIINNSTTLFEYIHTSIVLLTLSICLPFMYVLILVCIALKKVFSEGKLHLENSKT